MPDNPFTDPSVQYSDFVLSLNAALGPVERDAFWRSEPDKYVSKDAVRAGANAIALVMTEEQFETLFRRAKAADFTRFEY